jgi:hypothetical protein
VDDFLGAVKRANGDDRRAYERVLGSGVAASLSIAGDRTTKATVRDISRGGIALTCDRSPASGIEVQVDLPAGGSVPGRVVRSGNGMVMIAFRQDASTLMRIDQAIDRIQNQAAANAA